MHRSTISILVLVCGSAFGQAVEPARPRVTTDLAHQIQAGIGKMAEAEAVKLLPDAYRLEPGKPAGDWRITCRETTEIEVDFADGKLRSWSARFDPSVKSKNLTPEQARLLKDDLSLNEVITLLGTQNRRLVTVGKDNENRRVETWRWVHGRELWFTVTNGIVTGCGHIAYMEN